MNRASSRVSLLLLLPHCVSEGLRRPARRSHAFPISAADRQCARTSFVRHAPPARGRPHCASLVRARFPVPPPPLLPWSARFPRSRRRHHARPWGDMEVADERQTGTAAVIDGTSAAKAIRAKLKEEVAILRDQNPRFSPMLAIVQVGAREDSNVYIRMKEKAAAAAGVETRHVKLSEAVSQEELLDVVRTLNADPSVHGILVQLPLPESIDDATVTDAVDPRKDVDGLHPTNLGALSKRNPRPLFVPCTPKGVMELLRWSGTEVAGKTAAVVGRSDLVGAPVAALLTAADATVTLCHSKTPELPNIICHADILVVAIGRAEYIRGEWIKPGAVVIDVGMNSVPDPSKKGGKRWVGDVDYEGASRIASAITPVPGGVGPMTVAMLIDNVVISAKRAAGIEV